MKSDGTQQSVQISPGHMTEELNKMHRLRNLQQPGPNLHGPVHGGGFTDFHSGDKSQRIDARSPGIPPGLVCLRCCFLEYFFYLNFIYDKFPSLNPLKARKLKTKLPSLDTARYHILMRSY